MRALEAQVPAIWLVLSMAWAHAKKQQQKHQNKTTQKCCWCCKRKFLTFDSLSSRRALLMCRNSMFMKVNLMTQLIERLLKSVNSISTENRVRPADWIWNTIQIDKGKKSFQKECRSKESFSIWFHFFTKKIASWKINIRNTLTSSQKVCLFFHESYSLFFQTWKHDFFVEFSWDNVPVQNSVQLLQTSL